MLIASATFLANIAQFPLYIFSPESGLDILKEPVCTTFKMEMRENST